MRGIGFSGRGAVDIVRRTSKFAVRRHLTPNTRKESSMRFIGICLSVVLTVIVLPAFFSTSFAQPPFEVPLTVANGQMKRDTFRVRAQMGDGIVMIFSWPSGLSSYFSQLILRYFDGTAYVYVNMLTDTTVDMTAAGEDVTATIYSGGLVTSVTQTSPAKPAEFVLEQNYPNPFNPATKIRFSLPTLQFTTLKVYDLLGQQVATLVNETLGAGTYE